MKITKRQLKRIIQEELTRETKLLSSTAQHFLRLDESKVYLSEGSHGHPSRYVTFGMLMENRRRGIISERQMIRLWERSAELQLEQLLTEDWMDDLKAGYESVKTGVIKVVDKMSTAAAAAWKKANDIILTLARQAAQLGVRTVDALESVVTKLMGWNAKFKENHPLLHRIVSIIIFMVIIFGIMSMFSEAHASVQLPDGVEMNDTQYEALRGLMSKWMDSYGADNMQKTLDIGHAIKTLDNAYQSSDPTLLNQLGEHTGIAFTKLQQVASQAREGDEAALTLLRQWIDVGQNMVIR